MAIGRSDLKEKHKLQEEVKQLGAELCVCLGGRVGGGMWGHHPQGSVSLEYCTAAMGCSAKRQGQWGSLSPYSS